MTEYALYDMEDNEVLLGIYTAEKLAEILDVKRHSIYSMTSKGCLFKRRYKTVRLEEEER